MPHWAIPVILTAKSPCLSCYNQARLTQGAGINMFTYKEISTLNELELMVYNTIIKNTDKVMYMTLSVNSLMSPVFPPRPYCVFAKKCIVRVIRNSEFVLNYIWNMTRNLRSHLASVRSSAILKALITVNSMNC